MTILEALRIALDRVACGIDHTNCDTLEPAASLLRAHINELETMDHDVVDADTLKSAGMGADEDYGG